MRCQFIPVGLKMVLSIDIFLGIDTVVQTLVLYRDNPCVCVCVCVCVVLH